MRKKHNVTSQVYHNPLKEAWSKSEKKQPELKQKFNHQNHHAKLLNQLTWWFYIVCLFCSQKAQGLRVPPNAQPSPLLTSITHRPRSQPTNPDHNLQTGRQKSKWIYVHVYILQFQKCIENEPMVLYFVMYMAVSTYLANLLCAMANSGRLPMTYPLF